MQRRTSWILAALLVLTAWTVGVASMPKRLQAVNATNHASSVGGIPQWPWSPLGISWAPPKFGVIPYTVKISNDASLPQGQVLLMQPGDPGTTYQVGSVKAVVMPPISASIAQGTAVVHAVTIDGHVYQYDKVTTMLTTAYNGSFSMNGPWGAVAAWDGKPLHNGDVAVDPSIIPFGTYLYVDGYGPARAVDSGSAIWGEHIDLFFKESAFKVAEYGLQWHKVYYLTQKPSNYPG